jgi:uncharacterized lipoprotein YddW (UPF0748 family)
MWIATVDNIDWPSRAGLPTAQQKSELLAILDRAAQARMNAVVFQVRPACDALYASSIEPWSEYLTGKMGQSPEPVWDPLAFAVTEAHRRGLELHAWFNPYRARHFKTRSEISANHVSKTKPGLVRKYGRYLWLDPGDPKVRAYSLEVILDVVRRYDIDAVHLDDYFYPYKERGASGVVPFPDNASYQRYTAGGGKLGRDDWRRDNVNTFVQELYVAVKREKRWVKVGISPFGIWRPGNPASIRGYDAYADLYADARQWFRAGWVDYLAPQLYWPIAPPKQSYTTLLRWWDEQNSAQRHLWPGNNTNSAANGAWKPSELANQIAATRKRAGGNIHYSAKVITKNTGGIVDFLRNGVYAQPALPPASPWLDNTAPKAPDAYVDGESGPAFLRWKPVDADPVRFWVMQIRRNGTWSTNILPGESRTLNIPGAVPELVALSAVDRAGNQGPPVVVRIVDRVKRSRR